MNNKYAQLSYEIQGGGTYVRMCFFYVMKRVLFVTTISGFLSQFVMNDVKILQELGYEVHYASNFNNRFYSFDEQELIDKGIILHQIDIEKNPLRLFDNLKATFQLKRIIDKNRINLIHCNNPVGGVLGRISAKFSKTRTVVVYTAHGFHFYKGAPTKNWIMFYPIEKFMARLSDAIITINVEDLFRAKHFQLKKDGFVAQINGVGVDDSRFDINRNIRKKVRKKLGVENTFHIVSSGEINSNKNHKVVIDAISTSKYKDITYTICGHGEDMDLLRDYIEKLGLQDRVTLAGFRTDMETILQSADLYAFPSKREGLGISAVEALLCGIPLVVADNRGTREYARRSNSIVCNANKPEEFKKAIEYLYENRNVLDEMSHKCRESAKKFTLQATDIKKKKIYTKLDNKVEAIVNKG